MKKIIYAGFGLALLVSPLLVSADAISDLQGQIQALLAQIAQLQAQQVTPPTIPDTDTPTGPSISSCPTLTLPLQRGSRDAQTGGQVTNLQVFLSDYYNIPEETIISGYFGKVTESYVIRFQQEQGLPAFGLVGPMTRAKIAEVCGGITPPTSASFSASPTSGLAPLTVYFQGSGSVLTQSAYISFGDGTNSGEGQINISHVYQNSGTYTAMLHKDGAKGEVVDTATISVFSASDTTLSVTSPSGTWPADGVAHFTVHNPPKYPGLWFTLVDSNTGKVSALGQGNGGSGTTVHEGDNAVTLDLYGAATDPTFAGGGAHNKLAVSLFNFPYDTGGPYVSGCIPGEYPDFGGSCAAGQARGQFITTAFSPLFSIGGQTTGTGTLTVSTDASSPAYAIVAGGSTGVTLGVYRLRATGEPIKINKLNTFLSNEPGSSGSPANIVRLYVYSGSTLVGAGVFAGLGQNSTITLPSPVTIPKDTDSRITIKADLAHIGAGQPGIPGDLIRLELASAEGMGVSSGKYIGGNNDDRFGPEKGSSKVAGVRIFKSYPRVAAVSLPSSGLADGRLIRFSMTASPSGPVGIGQLGFSISGSASFNGQADLYAFTDSSYSSPINYCITADCHNSGAINGAPVQGSGAISRVVFPKPLEIPAGATYYFELRDSTKGSGLTYPNSVTTTLLADSGYQGLAPTSGALPAMWWSPNDTTTSAFTDADWTDAYNLPGLPASGISQTRTGSGTPPPSASFTASPTSGAAPLAVKFNIQGSFSVYGIDFGDGETINGAIMDADCSVAGRCTGTHTYTSPGTYTAKLLRTTYACQTSSYPSTPGCPTQTTIGTVTITVTNAPPLPPISVTSAVNVGPAGGGVGWRVAGSGDFNGDGKADILWQNATASDGQPAIWLMNGSTISSTWAGDPGSGNGWRVVGAGDLNGDGKADILWQNNTDGTLSIWSMNGTQVLSSSIPPDTSACVGAKGRAAGVGDFNGDGRMDILFDNASGPAICRMAGTSLVNDGEDLGGQANSRIADAGDFNGDGIQDILWQNNSTSQPAIWLMDWALTFKATNEFEVGPTGGGIGWRVVGAGDFNGDGKADILWQNNTDGTPAIWFMNKSSASSVDRNANVASALTALESALQALLGLLK